MPDSDKKIQLELELRDTVSATLKEIAGNLDLMNSKLTRGGSVIQESADTLQQISTHTRQVGEHAKASTRSLATLGDSLLGMARVLGGPVAVAGTLVGAVFAVSKALSEISNKRLSLKQLADNSGMSAEKISILQRAMERMGSNPDAANKMVTGVGGLLKELSTSRTGSTVFRGLADMGQAKFAKDLLAAVDHGDIDKVFDMIIDKYESLSKVSAAAATHYATVWGIPESVMREIKERQKGLAPAYMVGIEHAEDWAKRAEIMHDNLNTFWRITVGNMIWGLIHVDEMLAEAAKSPWLTAPATGEGVLPDAFGSLSERKQVGMPSFSTTTESKDTGDLKDTKKDSSKTLDAINSVLQGMLDKGKKLIGRQAGGPVLPGRSYLVGERGPELLATGGRSTVVGAGGQQIIRPADTGQVYRFDQGKGYDEGPRQLTPEQMNYVISGMQQREEAEAWHTASMAMSAAIAPHGIGWENWRRSSAIEDSTKFASFDPQTGAQIRGGPVMPREWFNETYDPRASMDAAMAPPGSDIGKAQLQAEIFFKNVPPGVKTSADADGFDQFKMNRSQQLENR